MLTFSQRALKRGLDIVVSALALSVLWWLILASAALARWDTGAAGFFVQSRVGRDGKLFQLIKIRSMRKTNEPGTTVTTRSDARITTVGRWMRKLKIDELPQLINVLKGDMSLVGPRPDVPEMINQLKEADLLILSVRPGITGPATLKYRDEEQLLDSQVDPVAYNRDVIFPDKVLINREYIEDFSIVNDMRYIAATVFPRLFQGSR